MKPRKTRNYTENHELFPCHSVSSVVINFCLSRAWLLSCPCLLAFALVSSADAQTFAPAERFAGMVNDGTRINADSIKEWHTETSRPSFAGRAIFDPNNPVRWIIDQSVPIAEKPKAYVEMFGGDRLPCRVIDYQRAETWTYESLGEYLIVEPLIQVDFPGRPTTPFLRISTEWLKRVVFDEKAGVPSAWHPGTVFLHDGSRISFRVVRWSGGGLSLLTDSGVKKLLFSQVAELHFPRRDEWDVYFEQLAALTPDLTARLVQAETSDGLRITVSTERLVAKHSGDQNKSENWYPLLHPAWSLDPITVPFRTVRNWRFFWADQPPMTLFEPAGTRSDPVFSTGWNWVPNLSVQSSVLTNSRLLSGWGFGVHAPTSLSFPLHPVVRQIRSRTGLDQVVGPGGCARADIALQSKPTQPFYRSEVFIGSEKSADSGWKNVTVAAGKSEHVVLIADPMMTGRPKGADPYDIRDCLNWLEPEWKLDKPQLLKEVAQRVPGRVSNLAGWAVDAQLFPQAAIAPAPDKTDDPSKPAPLLVRSAWDKTIPEDERTRLAIRPGNQFAVFTQQRQIEKQHRWLAVCISKPATSTDSATVVVRVDGRAIVEAEVPIQTSRLDPDPILVPISDFQGTKPTIEIVLLATGEKSFVNWQGTVLCKHPPGIASLFDETDDIIKHLRDGEGEISLSTAEPKHGVNSLKLTSGDRSSAKIPDFDFSIREYPQLGEFRYLRFSWKKKSGSQIGFQLAHDGNIGVPENEFGRVQPRAFAEGAARAILQRQRKSPRRPVSGGSRGTQFGYQYDAGSGDPTQPALRLDRKLPVDWRLMGRDLFGEFGSFTVTGLGFRNSDEEPAWFDEIYLARTQADFNWIDEVSGVKKPFQNDDPNLEDEARVALHYGTLISKVAPQFTTQLSGEPVQLLREWQGRQKIIRTLPESKEKPCVLKAPISVQKGKKTVLKLSAGRYPEADWQLVVRAAGQELFRSMVDANTAKEGWLDHDVDLSRFAGQNVVVEVSNEATGWSYEHGFWHRLEIVEE
jgi:hypothetical protein